MTTTSYVPVRPTDLGDEARGTVSAGINRALEVNGNPMSEEYVWGMLMTGMWKLYILVTDDGLAGFFIINSAPSQGSGAWVDIIIAWTDPRVVRRNGAGRAKKDVIGEAIEGFSVEAEAAGYVGLRWVTARKNTKVPQLWGFQRAPAILWERRFGGE